MSDYVTQRIDDPAAWSGPAIRDRQDWVVELSSDQSDAIRAAVQAAKDSGRDLLKLGRDDFPIPALADVIDGIHRELEGGRGFTVLRGLPIAEMSEDDAKMVLWGLGRHIGTPEPQDGAGNLLHSVRDTGARVETTDNIRSFQTNDPQRFHNDGCDTFMLMCRQTAKSGGRSRLASAVQIFNDILEQRPDLAKVLQEDFHMDARGQRPDGVTIQVMPIYHWFAERLSINLKLRYIHTAQRFDEVPPLSPAQKEAIALFEKVAEENVLEFDMQAGDALVANNYTIIHGRTGFEDWPDPDQRRHMLRLWLTLPEGRPLPPVFKGSREFGASYARRMN